MPGRILRTWSPGGAYDAFVLTIVTTILPLAFTLATGCGAESPPAGRETPFQKQSLGLSTGLTLATSRRAIPPASP